MEPCRAAQLRRRGSELSRGGSSDQWSHLPITFLRNRIRIQSEKSDPDPHQNEKKDPDPNQSYADRLYWFIGLWVCHAETMKLKNLIGLRAYLRTTTVITFYSQKMDKEKLCIIMFCLCSSRTVTKRSLFPVGRRQSLNMAAKLRQVPVLYFRSYGSRDLYCTLPK